jgi:hypothetical protein
MVYAFKKARCPRLRLRQACAASRRIESGAIQPGSRATEGSGDPMRERVAIRYRRALRFHRQARQARDNRWLRHQIKSAQTIDIS